MTKADIIGAAFRVWGRTLYQSTSLSQIAQDLGVSKSALYRHFKNKQALLEAMYEQFFDEYVGFIKSRYDTACTGQDKRERLLIMLRILAEYYVRHREAFIFSLMQVYANRNFQNTMDLMNCRGFDMQDCLYGEGDAYPSSTQLVIASLIFFVAYFHKCGYGSTEALREEQIREFIAQIEAKIVRGLGLPQEILRIVDFEKLERAFGAEAQGFDREKREKREDGDLLRAVASVVAEAGPWKASMDMVARRSGLSKSSLYSHFKNKQDMLQQLFLEEFRRIQSYAEAGFKLSAVPEEQLYLVILAIVDCLRSHPEILQAVDWLRTRRLNLNSEPPVIHQIFSAIKLKSEDLITEQIGHLILFLIINTLMHRPAGMVFSALPNQSIRILYRFITLGVPPSPPPPKKMER